MIFTQSVYRWHEPGAELEVSNIPPTLTKEEELAAHDGPVQADVKIPITHFYTNCRGKVHLTTQSWPSSYFLCCDTGCSQTRQCCTT